MALQAAETDSTLLTHLVGFGRRLRAAGVPVNPASVMDLCRAMDYLDIGARADIKAAAATTLATTRDEQQIVDRLFDEYWLNTDDNLLPDTGEDEEQPGELPSPKHGGKEREATLRPLTGEQPGQNTQQQSSAETAGYSDQDIITHKDLGTLDEEQLRQARGLIAELVRALVNKPGRRYQPGRGDSLIDFRRSFRHNLPQGFSGIELMKRKRKTKKLNMMLLCDVSGSMERYSKFLLEFVYALRHQLPAIEAGVFATHMTPITTHLDYRKALGSLTALPAHSKDWGGGTNIGQSLAEFNDHYAHRMLRSKTVMVILSDGWDRGDPELMRRQIARLRPRVNKLIWLNPLLGGTDYQPLCRGIRTALPYLDHFLPAHNLASLAAAIELLRAN